uniref:Uncharacterized protein n=1 Tax=Oryza glumipatula TaxID=40148 RepID=A0A0D9YCC1_9ORYZ
MPDGVVVVVVATGRLLVSASRGASETEAKRRGLKMEPGQDDQIHDKFSKTNSSQILKNTNLPPIWSPPPGRRGLPSPTADPAREGTRSPPPPRASSRLTSPAAPPFALHRAAAGLVSCEGRGSGGQKGRGRTGVVAEGEKGIELALVGEGGEESWVDKMRRG